jgi:seryl-tRNA synthetase
LEAIEQKLAQFKADKKRGRTERLEVDSKIKNLNQELKTLEKSQAEIETVMNAICIEGRNKYSKSAIQQDFADGIRELDMENAQEEDSDNFDPEDELRDYD